MAPTTPETAAEPELPATLLGAAVVTASGPAPDPGALPLVDAFDDDERLRVRAGPDRAVCWFERVGHVAIDAGATVVVHPDRDFDPSWARAYLYGLVATLVAGQQRRFALHASTVVVGDACVALSGFRGAGKTTTSLALVARGARPVTDDLTLLDIAHGRAMTTSIGRPAHVWPDALERLGSALEADATDAGGGGGKLSLRWPEVGPTAVSDVVVLARADVAEPTVVTVDGAEAVSTVHVQTSWRHLVEQVWPRELFAWRTAVADAVRIHVLRRPARSWPLDDLCARIESLTGA